MTNNNNITTAAPLAVTTRLELLEHNIKVNKRELRFNAEGRLETPLTAEEVRNLEDELKTYEGQVKGIYFMLQELSLHVQQS